MKPSVPAIGLCAAMVLLTASAWTAPKPLEVPAEWELEIYFPKPPQAVKVRVPGEEEPRMFWYLRYTVTNRTGEDQIFVPEFVLYTNTGQMIRAGQKTPAAVFLAIKKLLNEPLLKTETAMTGKLLQGDDNAKDGLAIWPDFDPKAGSFDVFVGGLSGETIEVPLPKPISVTETDVRGKTRKVMKDKIILTKTLRLRYAIPGEAAARLRARVKRLKKTWVMR